MTSLSAARHTVPVGDDDQPETSVILRLVYDEAGEATTQPEEDAVSRTSRPQQHQQPTRYSDEHIRQMCLPHGGGL